MIHVVPRLEEAGATGDVVIVAVAVRDRVAVAVLVTGGRSVVSRDPEVAPAVGGNMRLDHDFAHALTLPRRPDRRQRTRAGRILCADRHDLAQLVGPGAAHDRIDIDQELDV